MSKVYEVESFTDPSVKYKVVRNPSGWTCSCPVNYYKELKCDHIRKVQHIKLKWHGRKKK